MGSCPLHYEWVKKFMMLVLKIMFNLFLDKLATSLLKMEKNTRLEIVLIK